MPQLPTTHRMADNERKRLSWSIKKRLHQLTADEAYEVATHLDPVEGLDSSELNRDDEEGCVKYIAANMNSETLLNLEDEGMSMLLCLQDTVDLIIANRSRGTVSPKEGEIDTSVKSPLMLSAAVNANQPLEPLDNPTETGIHDTDIQKLLRGLKEVQNKLQHGVTTPSSDTPQPHSSQPSEQHIPNSPHTSTEGLSNTTRESMISLKDLSLLHRREFKIHGGQITDTSSDISFNSLCKQIEEGCREQHTDDEIIRGVLRIIKGGNFKDMLTNKEDLTVTELKSFLQSHLGEKSSTELFQELMCTRQHENEAPQQFLYRMIGLKQKIMFTSRQANALIKYDASTLKGVFLNAVYQGMGERHEDVRRELKPLLADPTVSDEALLRQVIKTTMEESERKRRLGRSSNRKLTQAHSILAEPEEILSSVGETQIKSKDNVIQRLSAQVEALTQAMETLKQLSTTTQVPEGLHQTTHQCCSDKTRPEKKTRRPYGCPQCIAQAQPNCSHCFFCGEEGHRAIGCLKRQKQAGNGRRSGQRDDH